MAKDIEEVLDEALVRYNDADDVHTDDVDEEISYKDVTHPYQAYRYIHAQALLRPGKHDDIIAFWRAIPHGMKGKALIAIVRDWLSGKGSSIPNIQEEVPDDVDTGFDLMGMLSDVEKSLLN